MTKFSKALEKQFDEFKVQLADFSEFLSEVADNVEAHYDDKSDSWKESDNGNSYDDWKNAIRAAADDLDSAKDSIESLTMAPE